MLARVCWAMNDGRAEGKGEPIPVISAKAWVEQLNAQYPDMTHWIEHFVPTEPTVQLEPPIGKTVRDLWDSERRRPCVGDWLQNEKNTVFEVRRYDEESDTYAVVMLKPVVGYHFDYTLDQMLDGVYVRPGEY